jgi:class 3 adenylate cyclase
VQVFVSVDPPRSPGPGTADLIGWEAVPRATVAATFVFTDLVDSTRLSTSMSPEAADDLRQRHFAVLRAAVTARGGTEVKNLGRC